MQGTCEARLPTGDSTASQHVYSGFGCVFGENAGQARRETRVLSIGTCIKWTRIEIIIGLVFWVIMYSLS